MAKILGKLIASGESRAAKLDAQMLKYDKKAYMSQRAANHGAAKAIFGAIQKGENYEEFLNSLANKIGAIKTKREAYLSKLQQKYGSALPAQGGVGAAGQARSEEYERQAKAIEAIQNKKLQNKEEGPGKKNSRIDKRISGTKKSSVNFELPQDTLLRVRGLKMYFGGLKAVDDLSFDVKRGEIFGLIGPNGAGKTTVFNCITRFYNATAGDMYFSGRQGKTINLRDFSVHDVILHGIVRTFQNVEVIREVSVLDNLLIAGHRQYSSSLVAQALHLPGLAREEERIRNQALRVLEFMGLTQYKNWYAFGLPYGVLKRIEIARTLMCDPRLIILDEPAAGLNDTETAELAQLIRRIRDEFNCTILLVEHDMGLVMDICDTICAISFGKLLAIGTPQEIQVNKDVQAAYLGDSEED